MIDFANEIFTHIAERLMEAYPGIEVKGEYVETPASFPCVSIEETANTPMHPDSRSTAKYALIRYRVQVFSNAKNGKRAEARRIFQTVDGIMQELNLLCKSMTTTPTVYHASIYQITATFEGTVSEDGTIYRS